MCIFLSLHDQRKHDKSVVNLEWQAALSQVMYGGIARLVPIRASVTQIPPILAHLKYIDMYIDGIEATTNAIIQIVEQGTVIPAIKTDFNNLTAKIIPKDTHSLEIEISAIRFVVLNAFFSIVYVADQDLVVWIKGEPAIHSKNFIMVLEQNGKKSQSPAMQVGTGKPLTPGIPVTLQVSSKGKFELHAIMHQVGENKYSGIPLIK